MGLKGPNGRQKKEPDRKTKGEAAFGEQLSTVQEIRESKRARGVKDALYINRTYYGLYNLLLQLNASVDTSRWIPEQFTGKPSGARK